MFMRRLVEMKNFKILCQVINDYKPYEPLVDTEGVKNNKIRDKSFDFRSALENCANAIYVHRNQCKHWFMFDDFHAKMNIKYN